MKDLWTGYYQNYSKSLLDFVKSSAHPDGCLTGRAGSASRMCGWYGSHEDFIVHAILAGDDEALQLFVKSILHWAEQMQFSYYATEVKSGQLRIRYKPPGEYVLEHGPNFRDPDSDIFRHAGSFGIAASANWLREKSLLTDEAYSRVRRSCLLYGHWLTDYDPENVGPGEGVGVSFPIQPGQGYGQSMQPRSLVGLFYLTGDRHWLRLARAHVLYHLSIQNMRAIDGNHTYFDTGRGKLKLGGSRSGLNGFGLVRKPKAPAEAELTTWPWYIGDWMKTLWRLSQAEAGAGINPNPTIHAALLMGSCLHHDRESAPYGDYSRDTAKDFVNHPIQGGTRDGRFLEIGPAVTKILTTEDRLALGDTDTFQPRFSQMSGRVASDADPIDRA